MHETYGYNPKLYPESLVEVANKVPRTYPRVEMNDDADKSAKHRLNWARAIDGQREGDLPDRVCEPADREHAARRRRAQDRAGAEDRLRWRRPAV
jgi:hypothetical protein